MWKKGQLITLYGKVYRIHECKYKKQYQLCKFCQQVNIKSPCINAYDYPEVRSFDLLDCAMKMPNRCIPKQIKPNDSGKSIISK